MGWRAGEEWPRPIRVAHGIRARSQRGEIGATWWSRRFLAALEARIDRGRLARGKNYARAGQVVSLDVAPGRVNAQVQGSRPGPYQVAVTVPLLDLEQWHAVEAQMTARAATLARLLVGEMPPEVEESFDAAGTDLFGVAGLRAACSCPDQSSTCKHIAAVFFLLAEAFDADPFLVLAWRGRQRDALIRELRALRPAVPDAAPAVTAVHLPEGERSPATGFWDSDLDLAELRLVAHPTTPPDAILRDVDGDTRRALGPDLLDALAPIYAAFVPIARRRLDPAPDSPDSPAPTRRRRPRGGGHHA